MKYLWTILSISISLLSSAQSKPYIVTETINASPDFLSVDLLPYTTFLRNSAPSMSISEVSKLEKSKFSLLPTGFFYKSSEVYWLRLELVSSSEIVEEVYLNFHADLRRIELYSLSNGKWDVKTMGSRVAPDEKALYCDYIYRFIPVSIEPFSHKTIFIRIDAGDQFSTFDPFIRLHNSSLIKKDWESIKIRSYVFIAIFGSMILYNLLLFIVTGQKLQLYYILWGLCSAEFVTSIYFLPQVLQNFHAVMVTLIFMNLMIFFFLQFTQKFLKLSERSILFHKIVQTLKILFLVFATPFFYQLISGTMLKPHAWQNPSIISFIIMSIAVFVIAIHLSIKKIAEARYFLLANSPFLIAIVICSFMYITTRDRVVTFYDTRYFVFTAIGIGTASQIVLSGLALGYRIIRLEKDKSQAVQDKLETQQTINIQLEEKVTERTSQLEHRNKENELLLGEIHHRVKNNLQVVSSLLKLQSRQLEEGQAKSVVLEGRDRVKAMALIHQRLYQQDQFSAIQTDDYIQNLVENLAESYGFDEKDFVLKLNVPSIQLDVDTAVPMGLIINELVSNSFKHAFVEGKDNQLSISLMENEGALQLEVQDNGSGISADFTIEEATSFGLQLIYALVEELDGRIQFENDQGTGVQITIQNYDFALSANEMD